MLGFLEKRIRKITSAPDWLPQKVKDKTLCLDLSPEAKRVRLLIYSSIPLIFLFLLSFSEGEQEKITFLGFIVLRERALPAVFIAQVFLLFNFIYEVFIYRAIEASYSNKITAVDGFRAFHTDVRNSVDNLERVLREVYNAKKGAGDCEDIQKLEAYIKTRRREVESFFDNVEKKIDTTISKANSSNVSKLVDSVDKSCSALKALITSEQEKLSNLCDAHEKKLEVLDSNQNKFDRAIEDSERELLAFKSKNDKYYRVMWLNNLALICYCYLFFCIHYFFQILSPILISVFFLLATWNAESQFLGFVLDGLMDIRNSVSSYIHFALSFLFCTKC